MLRFYIYLFFFGIYLLAAYFSIGVFHYDEHYQILEFARYKFGDLNSSELPWEFSARIRSFFSPFLFYMNLKFLSLFKITKPETTTFIFRSIHAIFGLFIIYKLTNSISLFSKKIKKNLLFEICFLSTFFFPMFLVRGSSENESSLLFWLGSVYFLRGSKQNKKFLLFLSGIFFGFSFQARFQIGFMIFGAGIWYLIFSRIHFSILFLAVGFIFSSICGILLDFWGYGEFQLTAYKYFYSNLVENKSEIFGTLPFDGYFTLYYQEFYFYIGLFFLYSIILFLFLNPKNFLSFVSIPFILVHFYIPHKETRFLFPILYVLTPMLFILFNQISKWIYLNLKIFSILLFGLYLSLLPFFIFFPREINFDIIYYLRKNFPNEKTIYYNFYDPFKGMNLISIPYFSLRTKREKIQIKNLNTKEKFIYVNYFSLFYTKNYFLESNCILKYESPVIFKDGIFKEILIYYFNLFEKEGFQVYECDFTKKKN